MLDWQNIIALTLVGLAAGYLLRKAWRRVVGRTKEACGTCSHCTATSTDSSQLPPSQPLVQIESQFGQAGQQTDPSHDRTHGHFDHPAR